MKDPGNRKISLGTRIMLVVTFLVLIGSVMILIRFSSGRTIDLTGAKMNLLNLKEGYSGPDDVTGVPGSSTPGNANTASGAPAEQKSGTAVPQAVTPIPASAERSFTMTVAGTVAIDGEVRKNSYLSDSKTYDFSD